MPSKGRFIVIEGLEGAGKSSALHVIKHYLQEQNIQVITTREPGGTHVGETARHLLKEPIPNEPLDPRAELLLFYAARVQLIEQVIRPALENEIWVLADRFELSTFAYQGGGRKLDENVLTMLSQFCVQNLHPDLIVFLDVQPRKGMQRVNKRGKLDRIEQESGDFFDNVYQCYHKLIQTMDNVVKIDANLPLTQVQNLLRTTIQQRLLNESKDYCPIT